MVAESTPLENPIQNFGWLNTTDGEKLTPEQSAGLDTFINSKLYGQYHQSFTLPTEEGVPVQCDYTLLEIPDSQTSFLLSSQLDFRTGTLTYTVNFITQYGRDSALVWEKTYTQNGNDLFASASQYATIGPSLNEKQKALLDTSRLSDKNWRIPLLYNHYIKEQEGFFDFILRDDKKTGQQKLTDTARNLYIGLAGKKSSNINLYNKLYIGTILENLPFAKSDNQGMNQLADRVNSLDLQDTKTPQDDTAEKMQWYVEPTMFHSDNLATTNLPLEKEVATEPPQSVTAPIDVLDQPSNSQDKENTERDPETDLLSAYISGTFRKESFFVLFKDFYKFGDTKINHPLSKLLDRAHELLLSKDCWSFSYKDQDTNSTFRSRYIALSVPESQHLLLVSYQEEDRENIVISQSCHFSWVRSIDIGKQGWIGEIIFTHKDGNTNIEVRPELQQTKLAENPKLYMEVLKAKKSWPQWFLIMTHFLDKRNWNNPSTKVVNLLEHDSALEDAFSNGKVDLLATASISRLARAQLLATEN